MCDDTVTFNSFAGLSFILLALAAVFYILAFGSTSWGKQDERSSLLDAHLGLWHSCGCLELDSDTLDGKLRLFYARLLSGGGENILPVTQ